MAVVLAEGFRAVGRSRLGEDVSTVLPVDIRGRPTREGSSSFQAAVQLGTHMLDNGTWHEFRVERFFYSKGSAG